MPCKVKHIKPKILIDIIIFKYSWTNMKSFIDKLTELYYYVIILYYAVEHRINNDLTKLQLCTALTQIFDRFDPHSSLLVMPCCVVWKKPLLSVRFELKPHLKI